MRPDGDRRKAFADCLLRSGIRNSHPVCRGSRHDAGGFLRFPCGRFEDFPRGMRIQFHVRSGCRREKRRSRAPSQGALRRLHGDRSRIGRGRDRIFNKNPRVSRRRRGRSRRRVSRTRLFRIVPRDPRQGARSDDRDSHGKSSVPRRSRYSEARSLCRARIPRRHGLFRSMQHRAPSHGGGSTRCDCGDTHHRLFRVALRRDGENRIRKLSPT